MGGAWRGGLALAGRGQLAGSAIFRCFLHFGRVLPCPAAPCPPCSHTCTAGWRHSERRRQSDARTMEGVNWRQGRRGEEAARGWSGRKWGEGAEVTGSVPREGEEEGRAPTPKCSTIK